MLRVLSFFYLLRIIVNCFWCVPYVWLRCLRIWCYMISAYASGSYCVAVLARCDLFLSSRLASSHCLLWLNICACLPRLLFSCYVWVAISHRVICFTECVFCVFVLITFILGSLLCLSSLWPTLLLSWHRLSAAFIVYNALSFCCYSCMSASASASASSCVCPCALRVLLTDICRIV